MSTSTTRTTSTPTPTGLTKMTTQSMMNQDDIMQNIKIVKNGLEALRAQQTTLLKSLLESLDSIKNDLYHKAIIEDEITTLKNFTEAITFAISEATVNIQLGKYLQTSDAEKHRLRSQIKILQDENIWLRDELTTTQKKLQESEQYTAQIEVELSHLKFLKELNKYDEEYKIEHDEFDENKKLDLGFYIDDKKYEQFNNITNSLNSSSSLNSAFRDEIFNINMKKLYYEAESLPQPSGSLISTSGYEIPTRLKTLHNLVVQYASQGRYEIAVPLCKQALADIAKTSGDDHPDIAIMLNILALVYRNQGRYEEAANSLNEALIIREKTLKKKIILLIKSDLYWVDVFFSKIFE